MVSLKYRHHLAAADHGMIDVATDGQRPLAVVVADRVDPPARLDTGNRGQGHHAAVRRLDRKLPDGRKVRAFRLRQDQPHLEFDVLVLKDLDATPVVGGPKLRAQVAGREA